MGLIHSRASKKRDRAEAELARAQAKLVRQQAKAIDAEAKATDHDGDPKPDLPWYRQPTLGAAIKAYRSSS